MLQVALWMTTAVLLAIVLGLGGFAFIQRRRLRGLRSEKQHLTEAIEDVGEVLAKLEETGDFSLRCTNARLRACWQAKECGRTDCAVFEETGLRCWQMERPLCLEAGEDRGLFGRARDCALCQVYLEGREDPAGRLIEQFNDVMCALEGKARLLRKAQGQVEEASRLASIGEFASGLAHEINNPLDGIMSCVARLEREPENLAQNTEYLHLIRDALKRLSEATQQLLEYSRKRELQWEAVDVHLVIENVASFMGMAARQKAIAIDFDLDNSVPLVFGDRHALAQVFLNLGLNAAAAIPETHVRERGEASSESPPRGRVLFKTRAIARDDGDEYVEVSVIDDGAGVESEHMGRIFEPFFTTKDPGKGTGMGLTIVRSLVEEHRGTIEVLSSEAGTTVRVALPVDGEAVEAQDGSAEESQR